ncbi:glycosyltransferase family 2 protein [Hutsoniella sourekii]|uniref:glycosyltransferase family 2 protein n=1 Tax=Hutsoniella sourekii TaxID=87650 RepID=UPI00048509FE|nr:glycosyltransferase family 2 protein [Hutsoniella sourekii]
MKKNTITLIVPCYNEEASLDLFMAEIVNTQAKLKQAFIEVLLVNDGSQDKTLEVMKRLSEEYPDRVNYLSFSRNFGKEAAILAGMEHAQGEWVGLIDADLQDPPELLVEMHRLITEEGYDVAATRRVDRQGEPPIRSFFANLYYKINNSISDVQLAEGARDYRLMTRPVVEAVISLPEHNRFSKGIFAWVGFDVAYLEYENIERSAGESSWSFMSLFNYAIEGLISFSDLPLKIASYLGLLAFLGALIFGLYIIIKTLIFGNPTPGWPSLAVLIVGMGGLQLLCLGIVGNYIAKIYLESKKRPTYIIQDQHFIQAKH